MPAGESRSSKRTARAAPDFPRGPDTNVRLCGHANERFFERLQPLGVKLDDFLARIRVPNTARADEWDPDYPGSRVRRWVRMEPEAGKFLTVMVVLIRCRTSDDKVAIEVITLIPEKKA